MANKIKKKRFPVKPKEQGVLPWLVDHQGNIYADGGILGALTRANKAMDASKLGKLMGGASGISGIASGIASAASNAISGGMSTGVGGAMQTIGGLASNIPGVGGLIGAGVNVLGGLANRAFGSTINEEFVADTKASAQENAARKFDSSSAESVLQQQGDYQDMNLVSRDDVGKDGWFSDKAKNLAKSLNKQIKFSNDYNRGKIDMAFSNANEQEGLNLLSGYFGYGGPMMFKNGGGIHIKKANRGKFTEYCGGKVTSECIARGKHSSSPAVRKRATFAQNARGWKHGDGGPLDREFVERMNVKLGRTPSGYPSEQGLEIVSPEFDILLGGAKILQSAGKGIAKGVSRAITNDGVSKGSFKRAVYNMDDFSKYADAQFHAPIKTIIDKGSRYLSKKLTPKSDKIGKTVRRTWNQYRGMESAGELPSIFQMGAKYINDIDKNNKKAYGGSLVHGGDFSNGVTQINSGGLHSTNPFGGVQMGLDPQGVPNLVEEGEVVFNDYVFSNRLKVPKKDRKRLRLKEGTFADAAEKLQKESAERPNDPISRRGLEASMNRLAGIQEGVRERKSGNKFADGGKKETKKDAIAWANANKMLDPGPQGSILKGASPNSFMESMPTRLNYSNQGFNPSTGRMGIIPDYSSDKEDDSLSPTWMRYAPAVGSALGVFSDAIGLTNTPDYAPAEMIGGAITPVKPVGARQISNRLTYKPLDTNYEINKLDANQAAQRRALINTSGGNRATAAANLIAANANYGNQMGDLHRQAELYNQQQRQQVEGFNRGTNQFNAEAQMRADLANAQQAQQMNELRLRQKSAQAQMYDTANMRSSAGRAANLTNLFDNLGGIGQENFSRNMITSNPALLYDLDSSGRVQYKKNKKKKGGRLTYGR